MREKAITCLLWATITAVFCMFMKELWLRFAFATTIALSYLVLILIDIRLEIKKTKVKAFPVFWFESDHYSDWVCSIEDLAVMFESHKGFFNPSTILDYQERVFTRRLPKPYKSYGNGGDGDETLRDYLESYVDTRKLEKQLKINTS